MAALLCGAEIHVRPEGPIRTLADAQTEARKDPTQATVVVHAGTYYLPEKLVFTAADSGSTYIAAPGEKSIISGGMKLALQWEPYKNGIFQAKTPSGMTFDQFFINGKSQPMARYPNDNPKAIVFNGTAVDAFSKERAARWSDPAGGFIHVMHPALWGSFDYRITGKNAKGEITYEGGWQNNRPQDKIHPTLRFVENIFEELDAPGEWFLNTKTHTLYYYPLPGVDMKTARVEGVRQNRLIEFNGVKNIALRGFTFQHAARTFMEKYEPMLRSDWRIYRGGALFFQGSEDCSITDCEFDQLGGNAVFVSGYNRRIKVMGCDFHDNGANCVAFTGEVKSVRSPLFWYHERNNYADIDKTPGPKTEDYPADCLVENCLMRHFGTVEKQVSGVAVDIAKHITIRHCSIYDCPRAAINIGSGTFGGHVIEFCDIFDSVKETSDHGCFNSWGRDRYWHLNDPPSPEEVARLATLDAVETTLIRNNRWRCDNGWDIDLDDGSSNYEIYNNLCLNGGIKCREGFNRHVYNNITVNNTLTANVWFEYGGDVITHNIWMGAYHHSPKGMQSVPKWGKEIDYNLFTTSEQDRTAFTKEGIDLHSLVGDPLFIDPAKGDFRVKEDSPALKLGFKNFPMDQFGVQKPELKAIANTPVIPVVGATSVRHSRKSKSENTESAASQETQWMEATLVDLTGDDYSAFGVSKSSGGVNLKNVPADSPLAKAGLQTGDLIQRMNGKPVQTLQEFLRLTKGINKPPLKLTIVRDQTTREVIVNDFGKVDR